MLKTNVEKWYNEYSNIFFWYNDFDNEWEGNEIKNYCINEEIIKKKRNILCKYSWTELLI